MATGFKTGGRKPGVKNKVSADVKALAQNYGAEAIERLAVLMRGAESDQTSVAAARELLDRGYGKSVQFSQTENLHSFVVRLPEKAVSIESWQQIYQPKALTPQ